MHDRADSNARAAPHATDSPVRAAEQKPEISSSVAEARPVADAVGAAACDEAPAFAGLVSDA